MVSGCVRGRSWGARAVGVEARNAALGRGGLPLGGKRKQQTDQRGV